ncbi:MAG: hypothetical protein ACTHJN_14410 [Ginsengibacter sp.]
MNSNRFFILFFPVALLSQCKVPGKMVIGNYIDKKFGDTLKVYSNKTYDYIEKLNSGSLGLTQGKWAIKNKSIQFQCNHNPLVGYWLKIHKDSLSKNFQVTFKFKNTQFPVKIKNVALFKDGSLLNKDNFKKTENVVRIYNDEYDLIVIKTFNFVPITINHLNPNHAYIADIFPAERLYELDKIPFIVHRRKLSSFKKYGEFDKPLSFKKIRN